MTAGLADIIGPINFGLFSQSGSGTSIDALIGVVDLFPEESHGLKVTKTKYPVEDGSSRTDNSVVEPEQLVLRGFVSDMIPYLGGIVGISDPFRAKEAWGRIRALKDSRELVTVVTLLGVYENMQVISVDSTVDRSTGRALRFTMTLEELQIVNTLELTNLVDDVATKSGTATRGSQQSETPDAEETTVLQDIITGTTGFFN